MSDLTLKELEGITARQLTLKAMRGCGLDFLRCLCDPRIAYLLRRFPEQIWEVVAIVCTECSVPVVQPPNTAPPPATPPPNQPPPAQPPPAQPPPAIGCPLPPKGDFGGQA